MTAPIKSIKHTAIVNLAFHTPQTVAFIPRTLKAIFPAVAVLTVMAHQLYGNYK
jgi:hypothetical protein